MAKLSKGFEVEIHYKYVSTIANAADLLSLIITQEKIIQELNCWTYWHIWLVEEPEKHQTSSLRCLSPERFHVENVFHNALVETVNEPLIPFDKFSMFRQLM